MNAPDAGTDVPDAGMGAPDAGMDVPDAGMDQVCESRTFACGDTTCDALTEYCLVISGEGSCNAVQFPDECFPCSTQVNPSECPAGTFSDLEDDGEYPRGCTLTCE